MASGTPTYNDMYVLSQCGAYQNRVQSALIACCIAIANEGWSVPFHRERSTFCSNILSAVSNQSSYVLIFSNACACDSASISAATVATTNYTPLTTSNVITQQALVPDTDIYNAVSACFNSFIREPNS